MTTPAPPAPPPTRDRALDLVRTVALARVVAWHAFASTWLLGFASMPLMFFVAGTLIGPAGGRSYRQFVGRRARRLLLPLWAYAAAIGATMLYAPLGDDRWATFPDVAWRAVTWLLPLVDPADSTWHGGWLSNHLWYLRAYLWIVLLTPVLRAYARRPVLAGVLFGVGLIQLEVAARFDVPFVAGGGLRVLLGDFLVYGLFAMLGIAYSARRRAIPRGLLAAGATLSAGTAVALITLVGLPAGGINASYPAIALTGLAWVLGLGCVETSIRRFASVGWVDRLSRAVCKRAVTIYLWHPAAIVIAHAIVDVPGPLGHALVALSTVVFTAAAVMLVGWIEDVAAGRPISLHRLRMPVVRLATAIPASALVLAVTVPILVVAPADAASGAGRAVRPPSYREALTQSAFARKHAPPDTPFVLKDRKMPTRALQKALDKWMKAQEELDSVAVGLVVEGQVWTAEAGRSKAPKARAADRFRSQSITKSFTIALVAREAEAGRIDLDRPVPRLRGISVPPGSPPVTPRQLLMHTSGLANYMEVPGYDPDMPITPEGAVNLALRAERVAEPGDRVYYSNTNYLYLGVLLERVTGRSFDALVGDLAGPLALRDTALEAPPPGWAWHASGGVYSTVTDLARWGDALFTPGAVLPPHRVAELTTLTEYYVGLGTWPICPCWTDAAGARRYTAIGQYVGFGGMYHFPGQMTLVVRVDPENGEAAEQFASLAGAIAEVFLRR